MASCSDRTMVAGGNSPTVSVIMAAYNAARYIGSAIESVQAQTFSDWELIVVNDGSKDETGAIAEQFAAADKRIQVLHQANSGAPGRARNAALAVAKGQFIAFLDADDLYSSERLEILVNALRSNLSCALVFHDFATIGADGATKRPAVLRELAFLRQSHLQPVQKSGDLFRFDIRLGAFLMTDYVAVWTSAVLINTQVIPLREIRFEHQLIIGEDLDLWLRLLLNAPVIFMDKVLAFYRKHEAGITNVNTQFLQDTIYVIENHKAAFSQQVGSEAAKRIHRRLRILYANLGYDYLVAGQGALARKWYARGLIHYGSVPCAVGIVKTCLPWAEMRQLWYRARGH